MESDNIHKRYLLGILFGITTITLLFLLSHANAALLPVNNSNEGVQGENQSGESDDIFGEESWREDIYNGIDNESQPLPYSNSNAVAKISRIYETLSNSLFLLIDMRWGTITSLFERTTDTMSNGSNHPNIIVIMTDDQDIFSIEKMPKVQKLLMEKGTTFNNSFVSNSLCCPSRATFLTGQYSHNNGIMGNAPPAGGYGKLDHTNTLPVWLQKAGYYTGHIGKYLNGYGEYDTRPNDGIPAKKEIPPGWSEWYGSIDPTTYNYYNYTLNENGLLVKYLNKNSDYQTDIYAKKAVDFIKRRGSASDGKPFFLSIAPLAPHVDLDASPGPLPAARHNGLFENEPLPMRPNFNEADISDKPSFIQSIPKLNKIEIDKIITVVYQRRLETLLAVDDTVESIVNSLEETNQLDNTFIIFTSDNGFIQGEYRLVNQKVLIYEPSIRVPLAMRGPHVPEGKVISELVGNIDLAPTIIEISNATPRRKIDGISLLPLLKGQTMQRDSLLIEGIRTQIRKVEINQKIQKIYNPPFQAIRTKNYIYAEYENGEIELYDLMKDPYELENKNNSKNYQSIKAELKKKLKILRNCSGKSCTLTGENK